MPASNPHASDRPRKWIRNGFGLLVFALITVTVAEVAARGFWRIRFTVSARHPDRVLYAFYPELRWVTEAKPGSSENELDILLLGGSTLHKDWGSVEQALKEGLAFAGHRGARVHNLAMPAQTVRDARVKYEQLGDARFALVVVYSGLNEVRLNNIPPELFRDDLSHSAWYEVLDAVAPYHGKAAFALPHTLRYLRVRQRQVFAPGRYAPMGTPRQEWTPWGADFRSGSVFEDDLSAILGMAASRNDRVVLMTYATHIPAEYTEEGFRAGRLGYGLHQSPVDLWGRREHVEAAVEAHNEVVRRLAGSHDDVLYVDQARLMAGRSDWFNDPCHFTVAGSIAFVENLLEVALPALARRESIAGEGSR